MYNRTITSTWALIFDKQLCTWKGDKSLQNKGKNPVNHIKYNLYRGPAPFHRLTPNKRFEPVFSTVIMAVCSLFNRMLLLTDLIPVHLLYCGQTVMIGCNYTSYEWTRAVRHIYRIIRHMQGLYEEIAERVVLPSKIHMQNVAVLLNMILKWGTRKVDIKNDRPIDATNLMLKKTGDWWYNYYLWTFFCALEPCKK